MRLVRLAYSRAPLGRNLYRHRFLGFRSAPPQATVSGSFGANAGRRGERAFVLLEVVISLTILAITVGAILRSFSLSLSAIRQLDVRTQAEFFAQQLLDEFEIDTDVVAGDKDGNFGDEYPEYSYHAELSYAQQEYDDVLLDGIEQLYPLRQVKIDINYDNGRNRAFRAIHVESAIMGFEPFSLHAKLHYDEF